MSDKMNARKGIYIIPEELTDMRRFIRHLDYQNTVEPPVQYKQDFIIKKRCRRLG